MIGYTAFEVEAERRREVLADSMRDARHVLREDRRPDNVSRRRDRRYIAGLTALTAGLRALVSQRI